MAMQKRDKTNYIVVHCSATPPSMEVDANMIDRWHRERGWFGIGYHMIIKRDGAIEYGRDHDVPGAHARGHNWESIAVCLIGGVSESDRSGEDNFTDDQWNTLSWVLRLLTELYPEAEVVGHRDLPNVAKACPSFDVKERLEELLAWRWDD